jgi:hypothetical protein
VVILELAVFLTVPREVVRKRLMRRRAAEGLFSAESIRSQVEQVDLHSYERVELSKHRADMIMQY